MIIFILMEVQSNINESCGVREILSAIVDLQGFMCGYSVGVC
jgi:hypothetical protein